VILYCLPFAGGSARFYSDWELLHIQAEPLELPGRGARADERPLDNVLDLVAATTDCLRQHRPFWLFGHSLGALLAYELAHEAMASRSGDLRGIIVSGHNAPHLPIRPLGVTSAWSDSQVVEALRAFGGTEDELIADEAFTEFVAPILRADLMAGDNYRFRSRPRLQVPVLVLGGLSDSETDLAGLNAWREHTTARTTVRLFPGGHFFLNDRRDECLSAIDEVIRSADRATTV